MSDVTLTAEERESVRQAQLDYWRRIPWASGLIDQDAEFEEGEKEIWHNGEGRSMCAAVESILASRLADRDAAGMETRVRALADRWMRDETVSADYQDGRADCAEDLRIVLSPPDEATAVGTTGDGAGP